MLLHFIGTFSKNLDKSFLQLPYIFFFYCFHVSFKILTSFWFIFFYQNLSIFRISQPFLVTKNGRECTFLHNVFQPDNIIMQSVIKWKRYRWNWLKKLYGILLVIFANFGGRLLQVMIFNQRKTFSALIVVKKTKSTMTHSIELLWEIYYLNRQKF